LWLTSFAKIPPFLRKSGTSQTPIPLSEIGGKGVEYLNIKRKAVAVFFDRKARRQK